MGAVILVRHTEISRDWKNRCYGVSDIPLSAAGVAAISAIAENLASLAPARVIHSGLSRTQSLAADIARHSKCRMSEDKSFQELNFGSWEGRSWVAIFAEVGHAMSRMITEPETFAPPNGETVHAVRDRVVRALLRVPVDDLTIVVTHGGPIGAVRGTLQNIPANKWPGLVPQYGEAMRLTRSDLSKLQAALRLQA